MPEVRFPIQWSDGTEEIFYSPSSVVKDYFSPGQSYSVADFVARSRQALTLASQRVEAKYGSPCSLALGQLKHIEMKALQFENQLSAKVQVLVQPGENS